VNILFVADIFGSPGRRAVRDLLPEIVASMGIDLVIANVENAAAGFGVTKEILEEVKALGVGCMTSGNHIWDRREALGLLDEEPLLLRPHNYPSGVPGRGVMVARSKSGAKVGVINLMGRVFMRELLDPFRVAEEEAAKLREETPIIIVDFHAEATAEKIALGWHLDGKISALIGTHTHVQTADERILPKGTACLTDAGMTGPHDSIIGVTVEAALGRFLNGMPTRFESATGAGRLNAVIVTADLASGKATAIERLNMSAQEVDALAVSATSSH
jgi:2',3'-cyclic-nucleotide 2'-phosphodiesterase